MSTTDQMELATLTSQLLQLASNSTARFEQQWDIRSLKGVDTSLTDIAQANRLHQMAFDNGHRVVNARAWAALSYLLSFGFIILQTMLVSVLLSWVFMSPRRRLCAHIYYQQYPLGGPDEVLDEEMRDVEEVEDDDDDQYGDDPRGRDEDMYDDPQSQEQSRASPPGGIMRKETRQERKAVSPPVALQGDAVPSYQAHAQMPAVDDFVPRYAPSVADDCVLRYDVQAMPVQVDDDAKRGERGPARPDTPGKKKRKRKKLVEEEPEATPRCRCEMCEYGCMQGFVNLLMVIRVDGDDPRSMCIFFWLLISLLFWSLCFGVGGALGALIGVGVMLLIKVVVLIYWVAYPLVRHRFWHEQVDYEVEIFGTLEYPKQPPTPQAKEGGMDSPNLSPNFRSMTAALADRSKTGRSMRREKTGSPKRRRGSKDKDAEAEDPLDAQSDVEKTPNQQMRDCGLEPKLRDEEPPPDTFCGHHGPLYGANWAARPSPIGRAQVLLMSVLGGGMFVLFGALMMAVFLWSPETYKVWDRLNHIDVIEPSPGQMQAMGMQFIYAWPRFATDMRFQFWVDEFTHKCAPHYTQSAKAKDVQLWIDTFQVNMQQFEPNDASKYPNINTWLIRPFKQIDTVRPLAGLEGNTTAKATIVSPADARVLFFQNKEMSRVWVKGQGIEYSDLVGGYGPRNGLNWDDGMQAVFRLSPQDYHRFHSPVTGTITLVKEIPGTYWASHPVAARSMNGALKNERYVILIDTFQGGTPSVPQSDIGTVAVVAVGSTCTGSVRLYKDNDLSDTGYLQREPHPTAEWGKGDVIAKGDQLGVFQFGGSTVVVLFEAGRIAADYDLLYRSTFPIETRMKVRQQFATAAWAAPLPPPPPRPPIDAFDPPLACC